MARAGPVLLGWVCLLLGMVAPSAQAFGPLRQWGGDGAAPGQLAAPNGVALGPDGSVYVLDAYNQRVSRFDSRGHFLNQWGAAGGDDGQFLYPRGLSVGSQGDVFVADTENDRIESFAPNGSFLATFGRDHLDQPWGVSVQPDGALAVADRKHDRIAVFSAAGELLRAFSGDGPAPLHLLRSVAAGDGGIYVIDYAGLHRFTDNGQLVWERLDNGYNAGVAVDSDGNVYAGRQGIAARVDEFSAAGKLLGSFGSYGKADDQFQSPSGLAVDCAFNIYIADAETHRLIKWGGSPEQFPPCLSPAPPPDAPPAVEPAPAAEPTPSGSQRLHLTVGARHAQRVTRRKPLVLAVGCDHMCRVELKLSVRTGGRSRLVLTRTRSALPAGTLTALHLRLPARSIPERGRKATVIAAVRASATGLAPVSGALRIALR